MLTIELWDKSQKDTHGHTILLIISLEIVWTRTTFLHAYPQIVYCTVLWSFISIDVSIKEELCLQTIVYSLQVFWSWVWQTMSIWLVINSYNSFVAICLINTFFNDSCQVWGYNSPEGDAIFIIWTFHNHSHRTTGPNSEYLQNNKIKYSRNNRWVLANAYSTSFLMKFNFSFSWPVGKQGYRFNRWMLLEISQLEGGKCIEKWTLKLR